MKESQRLTAEQREQIAVARWIREYPDDEASRPIGLVIQLTDGRRGYSLLHPLDIAQYWKKWSREKAYLKAFYKAVSPVVDRCRMQLLYDHARATEAGWVIKFNGTRVLQAFEALDRQIARRAEAIKAETRRRMETPPDAASDRERSGEASL